MGQVEFEIQEETSSSSSSSSSVTSSTAVVLESESTNKLEMTGQSDPRSFENDDIDDTDDTLQLPLLSQKEGQQQEISESTDDNEGPTTSSSSSQSSPSITTMKKIRKRLKSIGMIYANQSGSFSNLCHGLSLLFVCGTILGLIMPKDQDLPTAWYRVLSSVIGYSYFMSWSISYYPQVITNHQRKSITGLSTDSTVLTVLNCACYAIYNSFFFWDKGIRQEYQDINSHNNDDPAAFTVQSNDVAFSLHALLISILVVLQVVYYGGFHIHPLSYGTIAITTSVLLFSVGYITCILLSQNNNADMTNIDDEAGNNNSNDNTGFLWINFLYQLANIKILLSSMAYIPQLLLNYERKSTVGFNIWSIVLDFSGGFLSLIQLLMDCFMLGGDFWTGIRGNSAKLLLSMVTLLFDSAFFIQHYILYRDAPPPSSQDMTRGYSLWEDQHMV